ncbi:hypothetical protein SAMN04488084_102450 [Pedobacter antarcticus]|nr:hypothetical protein SAMN04488084_102450 [Pedobacter antarcticus]SFE99934.1 hypothetical protein SAMN03003324_02020 [Pedobacter antarcticus]
MLIIAGFILLNFSGIRAQGIQLNVAFYGLQFKGGDFPSGKVRLKDTLSAATLLPAYLAVRQQHSQILLDSLKAFRQRFELNDWLYYQLVRKVAQELCPKNEDYNIYTLYKWYFLTAAGFDARLAITGEKLIFYIYNEENIEDIPFFMFDKKKYMCLNIHDFEPFDIHLQPPVPLVLKVPGAVNSFSYRVTRLPDFEPEAYQAKSIDFIYNHRPYHFNIVFNQELKAVFNNYPIVDFASYFNIPLSKATYESLIPLLKNNMSGMGAEQGIDYLMRFTRYAFLYENDQENFGRERRLSPEETLFSPYSDCDDRAGLFFYLVKEIYNLPMIALLYPGHINIAVALPDPKGTFINYKGKSYTVCEPTPQSVDLPLGAFSPALSGASYEVVYVYDPAKN